MIVVVPWLTPVTTPVVDVAKLPMAVLVLLHVPPAGVEFSVVVKPTHTLLEPVMLVGFGFTVTIAEVGFEQPVPSV